MPRNPTDRLKSTLDKLLGGIPGVVVSEDAKHFYVSIPKPELISARIKRTGKATLTSITDMMLAELHKTLGLDDLEDEDDDG